MELKVDENVLVRASVEWWIWVTAVPIACMTIGVVALVVQWVTGVWPFWPALKHLPWVLVAAGIGGGYVGWIRGTRRLHYLGWIESGLLRSLMADLAKRATDRGADDIPGLVRQLLDERIGRLPRIAQGLARRLSRFLANRLAKLVGTGDPVERVSEVLAAQIKAFHRWGEIIAIFAMLLVFAYPLLASAVS